MKRILALLATAGLLLIIAPTPASAAPQLNCDPSAWDPAPPPGWVTACETVNAALSATDPALEGSQRVRDCLNSRSPFDWSPNFIIGCAAQF